MIPVRDTIPSRTTPVVTWSLLAVNTIVFFYELGLEPETLRQVFFLFGVVPARFTHPEWVGLPVDEYWPFLTSMFLHGSWGHLIGNMWTLWIFADNVEDRMGHGRFLVFYLLTGLAAGLTHLFTNPDSLMPAVGASGAIAGVLGAYFLLFPHSQIIVFVPVLLLPVFFELPAVFYLLLWFFTQLWGGALAGLAPGHVGGIAWWAHIGGFLAGVLLCRVFVQRTRKFADDEFGLEAAWD
jgi:membrane associated rhomboid family serine protease